MFVSALKFCLSHALEHTIEQNEIGLVHVFTYALLVDYSRFSPHLLCLLYLNGCARVPYLDQQVLQLEPKVQPKP